MTKHKSAEALRQICAARGGIAKSLAPLLRHFQQADKARIDAK